MLSPKHMRMGDFHMIRYLLLASLLWAPTAAAQDTDEAAIYEDLVHSDVPLWGAGGVNFWPQHFYDEDGSFGCIHNLKMGDWKLAGRHDEPDWYRLRNYGAFHCHIMVQYDFERANLGFSDVKYSAMIQLPATSASGQELWVMQMGGRPGSDYMLLMREADKKLITSFTVLQTRCSEEDVREGPELDSLATRYCAINSQERLIEFAQEMSELPPLGQLEFVEDLVEAEGDSE